MVAPDVPPRTRTWRDIPPSPPLGVPLPPPSAPFGDGDGSNFQSRSRSKRGIKLVSIIVAVALVLGGGVAFLGGDNSPAVSTSTMPADDEVGEHREFFVRNA